MFLLEPWHNHDSNFFIYVTVFLKNASKKSIYFTKISIFFIIFVHYFIAKFYYQANSFFTVKQ